MAYQNHKIPTRCFEGHTLARSGDQLHQVQKGWTSKWHKFSSHLIFVKLAVNTMNRTYLRSCNHKKSPIGSGARRRMSHLLSNWTLYGKRFMDWWRLMQPSWRTDGDGVSPIRKTPCDETWQVLRKGGTSGIYVVVMGLS